MKEIHLHTGTSTSRLLIGESLRNVGQYLPEAKTVIITDENIYRHHGKNFPKGTVIMLRPGESSKTMDEVSGIYGQLIQNEVDRQSFILGIGGGVVCDIAGFVASTYLRGLSFGFVATTLLAQVDASIGGKNGVNYEGYKNMVGVIRQPEFVLCDPQLLITLDLQEFRQGFAEVVKYGVIFDDSLFSYLETHHREALDMAPEVVEKIINECAVAKCRIVEQDEKESGERKKLNFGHTFAHAFEKLSGVSHGHAVSIGMVIAAGISEKLQLIPGSDVERLIALLKNFGLPVHYPDMSQEVLDVMKRDKKRKGNQISLVLIDKIGNAVLKDVQFGDLKNWTHDLC